MDLVKGAKLLTELFEKRGAVVPEKPLIDGPTPLFRWVGVEPPTAHGEAKQ